MSMLLITLLAVVELGANIWLYFFYHCDFEDSEIFKDVDPEINRKICLQSMGLDFTKQSIGIIRGTTPDWTTGKAVYDTTVIHINNYGFRGPDIEKDKPENTIRVFTMGGSTVFGSGVFDDQTFPSYLQKLFDGADLPFKVEVINAGWSAFTSKDETEKIKTELFDFSPDLFLVYDGWNDIYHQHSSLNKESSPTLWKERWIEICNLGDQYSYETIVTFQPFLGFGERILTEQEYKNYIKRENFRILEEYPDYLTQLEELQNHCSLTADLTSLFDNIQEPIYWDSMHVGPKGNQIIAEKFFQLSLPLVMKKAQTGVNNEDFGGLMINNNDNQLIQNESDSFVEDFYHSLQAIILPYKTPKVFPLIFE